MNNQMITYKKNIYLIMGIVVFSLLVVGGTYAYMTLAANVTNGSYVAGTTCFIIDYNSDSTSSAPITGMMFPSSSAGGGLFGQVSLKINSSCNVNGTGTLYLNVTSADSTLIKKVSNHCENSQTLHTLKNYTTSSTCTAQPNGIWVTSGSALKYAVYNTNSVTSSTVPTSVGYVNKTGSIKIYDNFSITKSVSTYYVYIWLDGNLSDNSYASLPFVGNVSASATQTEN